uniref:Uncharacterized protein n=1 Tax=Ciona savignyi TaxID=51511 RepID=H2Z5D3_CIOSA
MKLFCAICFCALMTSYVASSPTRDEKRQRELVEITEGLNVTIDPATLTPNQTRMLFKMNSYCQCECCHESPAPPCDRENPIQLPPEFVCPAQFCTGEELCRNYHENECEKSCFCRRCAGSLPDDDYRCPGNVTYMAPSCNCSALNDPVPCQEEEFDVHRVMWQLQLMLQRKRIRQCLVSCFCVNCDVEALAPVLGGSWSCDETSFIPEYCDECSPCPTVEAIRLAKQTLNAIRIGQAGYSKK